MGLTSALSNPISNLIKENKVVLTEAVIFSYSSGLSVSSKKLCTLRPSSLKIYVTVLPNCVLKAQKTRLNSLEREQIMVIRNCWKFE